MVMFNGHVQWQTVGSPEGNMDDQDWLLQLRLTYTLLVDVDLSWRRLVIQYHLGWFQTRFWQPNDALWTRMGHSFKTQQNRRLRQIPAVEHETLGACQKMLQNNSQF